MSDAVEATIAQLVERLRQQEAQAAETRRIINGLCKHAGRDPMFAEPEPSNDASGPFRADQFYGKKVATVIREVLESRRNTKGAQTVAEIYETMLKGGFKFETKNDENAKRSLYLNLSKNPIFHRVPSGAWGLRSWYEAIRENGATEGENSQSRPAAAHRRRGRPATRRAPVGRIGARRANQTTDQTTRQQAEEGGDNNVAKNS